MNKFDLNQENILAHIYYVNIRHVDLKPLEVLNAGNMQNIQNMQRHLAVRPERKEAKSKQPVQFSSGNLLRPLKTAIFMIKLVYLTCSKLSSVLC